MTRLSEIKTQNTDCFFVGVTRAKETLYIMNHDYDYQYNIGEEII
jgi:hypothetical protein